MPEIHEQAQTTAVHATTPSADALIANLTRAWHDQEDATSVNGAVMRTSTMNLVIFSAAPAAAHDAEEAMSELTCSHPCRAVHIKALSPPDAPLQASSHVHSRVENGVRVITCEQVTVEAGADALESLEGLVVPLLSPDLPVCLWWRGNPPFEGKLLEHLVQAADRIIYDSADFLEPEEDLPWVRSMVTRNSAFDVAFTDLNWARLTPWRALIAQFFDGARQVRALGGIDRILIEYADPRQAPQHVSVQAWLVLGWVATRLRWAPPTAPVAAGTGGTVQFRLRAAGGRWLEVMLRRAEGEDMAEGVTAVELHSEDPMPGTYRAELLASERCARTVMRVDGAPPLERVVEMERPGYAALIARELDMPGRDRVYEEALDFCARLQSPIEDVSSPS